MREKRADFRVPKQIILWHPRHEFDIMWDLNRRLDSLKFPDYSNRRQITEFDGKNVQSFLLEGANCSQGDQHEALVCITHPFLQFAF